jgi:ABC1 atypical kinase-like domain
MSPWQRVGLGLYKVGVTASRQSVQEVIAVVDRVIFVHAAEAWQTASSSYRAAGDTTTATPPPVPPRPKEEQQEWSAEPSSPAAATAVASPAPSSSSSFADRGAASSADESITTMPNNRTGGAAAETNHSIFHGGRATAAVQTTTASSTAVGVGGQEQDRSAVDQQHVTMSLVKREANNDEDEIFGSTELLSSSAPEHSSNQVLENHKSMIEIVGAMPRRGEPTTRRIDADLRTTDGRMKNSSAVLEDLAAVTAAPSLVHASGQSPPPPPSWPSPHDTTTSPNVASAASSSVIHEDNVASSSSSVIHEDNVVVAATTSTDLCETTILPPALAKALHRVRQGADAMPHVQLMAQLQNELGENWQESYFTTFDDRPFAAASIGQVSRRGPIDPFRFAQFVHAGEIFWSSPERTISRQYHPCR